MKQTFKRVLFSLLALQIVLLYIYFMDSNWHDTQHLKAMQGEYTVSNQLSAAGITAFVQDESLCMWIGTKSGLNIYNGHNYKQLFCQTADSTTIPDNSILALMRDSKGTMWVATPNGVARHVGWFKFRRYDIPFTPDGAYQLADYGEQGVLVNNGTDVYCIKEDKVTHFYHFDLYSNNSNYIFPDCNGGFWVIQPTLARHFDIHRKQTQEPIRFDANICSTMQQGDTLWLSQSRYLAAIDLRHNKLIYRTPEQLPIIPNAIYAKNAHQVLLSSNYHGLYSYDLRNQDLTKITDSDFHLRHRDVTICTFFGDADQNLWIGFQQGSFQVISPSTITYSKLNNLPLNHGTQGETITSLGAVGHHVIGSTEDRVFCYDAQQQSFNSYLYNEIFNDSPYFRQTLEDVVPYDDNRAWLISNVRILSCQFSKGKIERLARVFSREHTGPVLGFGLRVGHELLTTSNSNYLLRSRFGSDICDSIAVGSTKYGRESRLLLLPDGRVLIVMKGLEMALYHPNNGTVEMLTIDRSQMPLNADPNVVFIDSHKRIWIGTRRNGLYYFDYPKRTLSRVDFVPFSHIQTVQEDNRGELWFCSDNEIFALNPQDSTLHFSSYPQSTNARENNLYYINSCKLPQGNNLIVGTSAGCRIYPFDYAQNQTDYNLSIQGLYIDAIDNQRIGINSRFEQGDHFTFGHNENNLTFEFASVNYGNRERMMYQYMMEGVDKNWSIPTLQPNVSYTQLRPGRYCFKVRLIASQHHDALTQREIFITVKPSFWCSAAAIYFYFMCLVGIIFYIQYALFRNQKNKLRMEQLEAERARDQRTNEANMNFFANISHEFRNPLTIISGPLLMLKEDASLPYAARKSLNMVCMSVNRMLALIDQMLDFNKLETDALKLQVAQCDVVTRMQSLVTLVAESAILRGIHVTTTCAVENLYVWMDDDKFEKIMSNLLTNALKHTPDKGTINISLAPIDADHLCIKVYNSGAPIDDSRLQDIFKRYYQVKGNEATHQYGWGTGIGLYYVKRLTELHHGHISVQNEPQGGVSFIFTFPICEKAYTPEEHALPQTQLQYIAPLPVTLPADDAIDANQHAVNEAVKKPVILIVDDDIAVAQYTRSLFADDFVVVNKYSAESALEEIENIKPNIILSDVIMGNMNGYEFCRKLKSNLLTCHIPVILITAKSTVNEQVEGLKEGANAYVTKPFDPRYLKAVVESLLQNIKMLRQKLAAGEQNDLSNEAGLSEQDRNFLNQVYALMEKHISDQDLSVNTISQELLISHSKFNYKLKELTGEAPGTFFRKYKLNVAAKLLKEGKHNVSEVAYMTGFGTASYFSVAFKKQFGKSPSEYV